MIKKYIILISAILVISIFTSTSSASLLSTKAGLFERLQESTIFRKIVERLSQVTTNIENSISNDADEDNDIPESDGPEEDVLMPEKIDVDGEVTPDNGNEVATEENDPGETPTVDTNGEEGATLNDEVTVDENGEVGTANNITVEQDGETGRTLERVIEIVKEHSVIIGAMLERIVERTFASGTTESDGVVESIVDNVVVTDD